MAAERLLAALGGSADELNQAIVLECLSEHHTRWTQPPHGSGGFCVQPPAVLAQNPAQQCAAERIIYEADLESLELEATTLLPSPSLRPHLVNGR